jgi:hypothetical protein
MQHPASRCALCGKRADCGGAAKGLWHAKQMRRSARSPHRASASAAHTQHAWLSVVGYFVRGMISRHTCPSDAVALGRALMAAANGANNELLASSSSSKVQGPRFKFKGKAWGLGAPKKGKTTTSNKKQQLSTTR